MHSQTHVLPLEKDDETRDFNKASYCDKHKKSS